MWNTCIKSRTKDGNLNFSVKATFEKKTLIMCIQHSQRVNGTPDMLFFYSTATAQTYLNGPSF